MIKQVTKVDPGLLEQLVKLERDAFGDGGMNAWHLVPLIRHGRVYVALEADKVVGLAQYMLDWDHPRTAYLVGMSVDQTVRGQGIGTRLLEESFDQLSKSNISDVELTVDPRNIPAITVYERKFGFQVVAHRENEYGQGEDRLVMTLPLASRRRAAHK